MDDLSRAEYPAMLNNLQPGQALVVLQERVRRITKLNQDVADWIQERRRVEDQYVAGLKKLVTFKGPSNAAELGVFQPTWDSLLRSVETMASTHHRFSENIYRDAESPLRAFQNKREVTNMTTISANLQGIVKELEDAQDKSDKLSKKGKANTQKVVAAAQRLDSANQQWESQAPFIFETLQALDEQRVNQLRDVLTQFETLEVDQANRIQATAESLLNQVLEIRTADEIQNFVSATVQGRPKVERRATGRQSSIAGSVSSSSNAQAQPSQPPDQVVTYGSTGPPREVIPKAPLAKTPTTPQAPPAPPSREGTGFSESSGGQQDLPPIPQQPQESKLRSRIGTMLGRRRQSIHSGFGPLSPSKGAGTFSRISVSSHGRSVSPRSSSNNLAEGSNRLSSLAETPDSPNPPSTAGTRRTPGEGATNGFGGDAPRDTSRPGSSVAGTGAGAAAVPVVGYMTADEIFGAAPPPGPPPSQQRATAGESSRDADGFSVPPAANDPISLAQRDAATAAGEQLGDDADHAFKLSIQNEPVLEDPQAKQAALSNVVNTLSLGMPTRKTGTVRGRRDVRNTIYVPAAPPLGEGSSSATASPATAALSSLSGPSRSSTFGSTSTPTKPSAAFPFASDSSFAGSDTHSIRSATSLGGLHHMKHLETSDPGLGASIIESVSASFEGGELKASKIAGEVAFSYNTSSDNPPKGTTTIRINNFPLLEAIGPNPDLVQATSTPDEFTLSTSELQTKPTVGFTFRVHAENATALKAHCPLVVKSDWKPTGDKLGLIIQYRLNPDARLTQPVVLRNVAFLATYEGARASGVQTKPSGTHLKDKHLVYWRMSEITVTENWSKIVLRVIGDQGAEPKPGRVDVKWEYVVPANTSSTSLAASDAISISQQLPSSQAPQVEEEQDPFADLPTSPRAVNGSSGTATWSDIPTARQIASGRYESK